MTYPQNQPNDATDNLSSVPPWVIDPTVPPRSSWATQATQRMPHVQPPTPHPSPAVGPAHQSVPQDQHRTRDASTATMRRFTREPKAAYQPHSVQAQQNAAEFRQAEQQAILDEKLRWFAAKRILRYHGDPLPNSTNQQTYPIHIQVAPNIVRPTRNGLLIRGRMPGLTATTDQQVSLLPWHRIQDLTTEPNDPIQREL